MLQVADRDEPFEYRQSRLIRRDLAEVVVGHILGHGMTAKPDHHWVLRANAADNAAAQATSRCSRTIELHTLNVVSPYLASDRRVFHFCSTRHG
jgi:hypothetical protein